MASWLLELGPVRAVVAYAKESTKLNSAYATAQEAWNALDAAVVQGSEAALRSATTALAQARAAITLLTDKVESLAALIGFDSLATHIGGAGRECTADVAGLLAKYFKIADRDGLIEGLRTWGRNNNISSTSEAINRIGNAANLTVVESTSFGVAKPGAYAVFTGQHVVFGKVLSNGEKIVVDLSGELGQRVLRNAETDFLKTAEAVMFGPR